MARLPVSQLPKFNQKLKQNLQSNAATVLKRAATAGSENVIRGTPVDKGVLRSNWIASLNSPVEFTIPAYVPGRKLGLSESANAAGAISQNQNVISTFTAREGEELWIVNNVDYLGKINAGGSKQNAFFFEAGAQAIEVALSSAIVPLDRRL